MPRQSAPIRDFPGVSWSLTFCAPWSNAWNIGGLAGWRFSRETSFNDKNRTDLKFDMDLVCFAVGGNGISAPVLVVSKRYAHFAYATATTWLQHVFVTTTCVIQKIKKSLYCDKVKHWKLYLRCAMHAFKKITSFLRVWRFQ